MLGWGIEPFASFLGAKLGVLQRQKCIKESVFCKCASE